MRVSIDGVVYVPAKEVPDGSWIIEREAAIRVLRCVCSEFGDNDWPDDLHLSDVIEKHLYRPLSRQEE